MKLSHLLVVLASTVLLDGCALSDTENPFGAEDFDVPFETAGANFEPPAGTNGLLPTCFWDHGSQEALRALGKVALTSGPGGGLPVLPTVPAACREVVQYAVECALNPAQSVTDPVNGMTYTGHWSLADTWYSEALSYDGKRWVTACMLQRLNVDGDNVEVLMEANHPRMYQSAVNDAVYTFEESSAYGNLFDSRATLYNGRPTFYAYVCSEAEQAQSCPLAGGQPWINKRVCHLAGNECGLVWLGTCPSACVPNGPNDEYWSCKPANGLVYNDYTMRVQLKNPTACY